MSGVEEFAADTGAPRHIRRPWLLPFTPLYAAALRWKNRRFDEHRSVVRHLRWPVISVGSISAGGAGKTPFLIALAGLLREMGYAPDVLSRGYGRSTKGVMQVDSRGSAEAFGDEPLLLAQRLGCPVFVGAERFAAGTLAESQLPHTGRGIHLLDDGFSHRRVARTIDIILLTAAEVHDALLPAGNLREPLAAMRRADVLVLRGNEAALLRPVLERTLGPHHDKPVWTISRHLTLPALLPAHPLVFSGIARPADFERSLRERGIQPAGVHTFRDHHRYREDDAALLMRKAAQAGADGFLTTSKDAVKLDAAIREALRQIGPIAVADASVEIHQPASCRAQLQKLLRKQ